MKLHRSCSTHQNAPTRGRCKTCVRIELEQRIAKRVVRALLKAGYSICVNDGEEFVLSNSETESEILSAMFSTDENILFARAGTRTARFVHLIYGNGDDVIHDHSSSLSHIIDEISLRLLSEKDS